MAHWAEIDENNIVLRVVVTSNDDPSGDEGYQWLINTLGGTWIQTSINTKDGVHYDPETGEPSADQSKALRGNFAGVGFIYNPELDVFEKGPEPEPAEDTWPDISDSK